MVVESKNRKIKDIINQQLEFAKRYALSKKPFNTLKCIRNVSNLLPEIDDYKDYEEIEKRIIEISHIACSEYIAYCIQMVWNAVKIGNKKWIDSYIEDAEKCLNAYKPIINDDILEQLINELDNTRCEIVFYMYADSCLNQALSLVEYLKSKKQKIILFEKYREGDVIENFYNELENESKNIIKYLEEAEKHLKGLRINLLIEKFDKIDDMFNELLYEVRKDFL
jgi:hypothetical protein